MGFFIVFFVVKIGYIVDQDGERTDLDGALLEIDCFDVSLDFEILIYFFSDQFDSLEKLTVPTPIDFNSGSPGKVATDLSVQRKAGGNEQQ